MDKITRRSCLAGCVAAPFARRRVARPDRSLIVFEPSFVARADPESVRLEVWSRSAPEERWERLRFGSLARLPSISEEARRGWRIDGLPRGLLHVRVVARRGGRWTCATAITGAGERTPPVELRVNVARTRVGHEVRRADGGRVDAARVLPRARPVTCTLLTDGADVPPLECELPVGGVLRVEGFAAARVMRWRVPGPETADAERWAVRPGSRTASFVAARNGSRVRFVDEVAPVRTLRLRIRSVPEDAQCVTVHVRSPDGWRTGPASTELPASSMGVPVVRGGDVELLARAHGLDDRGEHVRLAVGFVRVAGSEASATVELARPAMAVVWVPGGTPGAALRARPEGWALDLAAEPLGNGRCAELRGLAPGRRHVVDCDGRRDEFVAPGPGRSARWTLR